MNYGYSDKQCRGDLPLARITAINATKAKHFNTEDMALKLHAPASYGLLTLEDAYIGLQARRGGLIASTVVAQNLASDSLSFWRGGNYLQELVINDTVPYTYTRKNHKDCVQAYYIADDFTKPDDAVFDGLYIGKLTARIRGAGKAVIALTEFCIYNNINLFAGGCVVDTDSEVPYLLLATNLQNSTIASPTAPLSPSLTSNKTIRILDPTAKGTSPGRAPLSTNSIIHVFSDFPEIILPNTPHSITVMRWSPDSTPLERELFWVDYLAMQDLDLA